MPSFAKFDVWQNTAGINYNNVIQVQSVVKTDTFVSSGTSAWSTITGLSVNITPRFATSRILLLSQVNAAGQVNTFARYRRNGTVIGVGDASGSRMQATASSWYYNADANTDKSMPMIFIDTPASTGLLTYDIQMSTPEGNFTYYVNRTFDDSNGVGRSRTISTIIAMEISQ